MAQALMDKARCEGAIDSVCMVVLNGRPTGKRLQRILGFGPWQYCWSNDAGGLGASKIKRKPSKTLVLNNQFITNFKPI